MLSVEFASASCASSPTATEHACPPATSSPVLHTESDGHWPRPLTPTPNSERRAPAQPSKPATAQLCRLSSSIAAGLVHHAEPPMPWPPRAALLRTDPPGCSQAWSVSSSRTGASRFHIVPAWICRARKRTQACSTLVVLRADGYGYDEKGPPHRCVLRAVSAGIFKSARRRSRNRPTRLAR